MIEPIVKRCAGLDVHKMRVMVTALIDQDDGKVEEQTREFKTFRKHRSQLCRWFYTLGIDLAIMEGTGNYCIHDSLEAGGIRVWVVNARHLKQVRGRKTDVLDNKRLAMVGRMGLIRPNFVPTKDFRELRRITRQRQKPTGSLGAKKTGSTRCSMMPVYGWAGWSNFARGCILDPPSQRPGTPAPSEPSVAGRCRLPFPKKLNRQVSDQLLSRLDS